MPETDKLQNACRCQQSGKKGVLVQYRLTSDSNYSWVCEEVICLDCINQISQKMGSRFTLLKQRNPLFKTTFCKLFKLLLNRNW